MSQKNPFVACIELSRYASLVNVAFRVLADGTVETDSVEEALKLRAALLRQESRKQATRSNQKPSDPDYFSDDTKAFLDAVSLGPLTSDQIAEEAKISTKSIPPLIRGLHSWANRHGFAFDDILIRTQTYVKGKPVSTYELTEKGCIAILPFMKIRKDGRPSGGAKPSENPKVEKPQ
jgi:hypothetical protein